MYGPDKDLMDRLDRASFVDRRVMGGTDAEHLELHQRLWSASTFADLSPADQAWVNKAVAAVNAGHAPRLAAAPDLVGGDWAAEDAAEDAGLPVPVVLEPTVDDSDDEPVDEDPAAGGWVGL